MRLSPPRTLYDDGLQTPRRYWAIAAMGLAVTMAVLDSTIANVALPSIGRDLAASPTASIWIVNAYQIAVMVSLLPLASLGEVVGYRRISQAGIVLFTLASLACALAPNLPLLCVARVVQGFGGAAIMGVNGALVRFTYPHRMLGRGIVDEWVTGVGLRCAEYGTHSLRRTKAAIIYKATGNLRAVQILLGNTKIENTVRYLGLDVEDALMLAEGTEI